MSKDSGNSGDCLKNCRYWLKWLGFQWCCGVLEGTLQDGLRSVEMR